MCCKCKWTVCVLVFGFFLQALSQNTTIVIHELSGTDTAQLGSNTTTIKCDYDYENDTGVEIKWFYNETIPIFLWVPDRNQPQPMGPFSNLLDVTNNSIRFKEMTKNLTGSYTCKVSSNEGEKSRTQTMVAYQPAKLVEFFEEETSQTLICAAYELYPLPVVTVFGSYVYGSNESIHLQPADDDDVVDTDDDFYNVTKTFRFDKEALHDTVQFFCNVFIPETNYNETKSVKYEKMGNESTTEYPDYFDFTTISTETSINSTTINSTTIISTNSTTQGDFAVVSSRPSRCLMMIAAIVVVGLKL